MVSQAPLVGRTAEREQLVASLHAAQRGSSSMTLVAGEPGIGKTALVRDLADLASADGFHLLFGQCLHFGAAVSSYLPFIQAWDRWLSTGPPAARDRVTGQARSVVDLVPGLAPQGTADPGQVIFQLCTSIARLAQDAPTLVVVDDVQWADPSSLDVLSYLVSCLGEHQPLAVVATYRDTDLGEGHRLHGWLADITRMPSVRQLHLTRLEPLDTERLALQLGGSTAMVAPGNLVELADGNPYLVELLVATGGADGGPVASSPGRSPLAVALLAAWHRLSAPARLVTQLLAMSGRPVAVEVLEELAAHRGVSASGVRTALVESTAGGITVQFDATTVWFRHPLIADVVAGTLPQRDVVGLHREYAELWESAGGVSPRDRANHLALHHAAAGHDAAAFRWSLTAADEAAAVGATNEEHSHLSRAVSLLALVPEEQQPGDLIDLLERAARVAAAAGEYGEAIRHHERALSFVDVETDPLLACRLLLPLQLLRERWNQSGGPTDTSSTERVLDLTEGLPATAERAMALALLAFAQVFDGVPTALEHAAEAVRLAESVDSRRALALALAARSQTRWGAEAGVQDAEEAGRLMASVVDDQLLTLVAICLSNSYENVGRPADAAAASMSGYRVLRQRGRWHHAASLGANAAVHNVLLGRWSEVDAVVREVMSFRPAHHWAAPARLAAAVLAAFRGQAEDAALHYGRALELLPHRGGPGDTFSWWTVQYLTAMGNPEQALELCEREIPEWLPVSRAGAEELLQLGVHAAAELAEHPDRLPGGRQEGLRWVERLEAMWGRAPARFAAAGPHDTWHAALGALYRADRARLTAGDDALAELWQSAADATSAAGMLYENARARYLLARTLLRAHRDRQRAAEELGLAHQVATELGARPLVVLIEQLAAQTHLSLGLAAPGEVDHAPPSRLAGAELTPREGEVLAQLVTGQTYGQIARTLFISEKTVSTHVSNLLRKTGAGSRIELAALASSSGAPGPGAEGTTRAPLRH